MHLKSAALLLSSAVLIGSAAASPTITRVTAPKTTKRQVQEITNELGCDAKGPLAGPWAVELFTCQIDSNYTCQATELSGCVAGDAANIESLIVLDSTTGQPLSGAASIAEAYFRCPENGLVQCAVHFANNGSEATSYGLRITNATEETPFSNATFGAPVDESTSSTDTATDSLSDFGESPTDSASGTSATDSSAVPSSDPSSSGTSSTGDTSSDVSDGQVFGGGQTDPTSFESSSSTSTSGVTSAPTSDSSGFQ